MTGRQRRVGMLALLALAIPIPALALDEGESQSSAAALTVSAALDHCGIADSAILCKIDASWNAVEHADSYMVSVTRSDGSVIDFGATGAAMTSVFVPYSGPGSYAIVVEAWGTPPQEGEPEVLARDVTVSATTVTGDEPRDRPDRDSELPGDPRDTETPGAEEPGAEESLDEPPASEPVCETAAVPKGEPPVDPATATIPECPTQPLPPPSPSPPETSLNGVPDDSSSVASG